MNIFQRPKQNPQPQPVAESQQAPPAPAPGPWPRWDSTFVALLGLVITAFAITSDERLSSKLAATAAIGVGATLALSFAFEALSGVKNLVRADLMAIAALYYLTLYEFLFPQPYFDRNMPHIGSTYVALLAVMAGFAGLFIGRHLLPRGKQPFAEVLQRPVPAGLLLLVFWASFILGYLHMLLAVEFDVVKMFDALLRARFDQPWVRGRLGDWKALINELALLLYFIPPLAGLMLARASRYTRAQLGAVLLGFVWTIFCGFVGGTRNQFGAYLVTFAIAFAFASPRERSRKVLVVFAICSVAMLLATGAMLRMRTVGFKNWWEGKYETVVNRQSNSVFVDDNLLAVTKIVEYFPEKRPYLGLEIPYNALVRPIPRALWPGKPQGLSVSVEQDVFKMKGLTISSTFIGEGYMSGGYIAVFALGIVLGIFTGFWNRLAHPNNSELGILIYASGFSAAVIGMRSVLTITTALLTPVAGIVVGKLMIKSARRVLGGRRPPPSRPPA